MVFFTLSTDLLSIMVLFFFLLFCVYASFVTCFFLGPLLYNLKVKFNKCQFFQFYRFFKSGLLFDFFLKRWFLLIGFYFFKIFNIEFSEKYFVENLFFKPSLFLKYVKNFFNIFSRNLIFHMLPIILFIILLSFIILGIL